MHVQALNSRVFRCTQGRLQFICKRILSSASVANERWLQEQVFPTLQPGIRCPRILNQRGEWAVYEDYGSLTESFAASTRLEVAKNLARLHTFAADHLPEVGLSHTPVIQEIIYHGCPDQKNSGDFSAENPFPDWLHRACVNNPLVFEPPVLCHGDMHPANSGYATDQLVLIDWEYAHYDLPHWDLYCLLDMTSPDFPMGSNPQMRSQVLNAYLSEREELGHPLSDSFVEDYFLYTATYSWWILGLIERDLAAGRHGVASLYRQRQETREVLEDCRHFFLHQNGGPDVANQKIESHGLLRKDPLGRKDS